MPLIPGPLVTPPEPVGRRYGLFTAAGGPLDMPNHGAAGGIRYVPVTCGEAHAWPIDCVGDEVQSTAKQGDLSNALVEADPFMVYASLECGPVGYTSDEFRNQILRRLQNGEQGSVEHALWTGDSDVGLTPLGIANFEDNAVLVPMAADDDIAGVVSALEMWAYHEQGYGNVAYIHAPVSVAAWAASLFLVVKDGNLLKTPYGSIWVFGGGYPGTGADGVAPPSGGAYLHITGQTTVWRSAEPFTYPVAQTLDRETNQQFLLAEREYAVAFDCFAGRALFNPLGGS